MSDDRDDYYDGVEKTARETLEVGQLWVKYPELPERHPNRKTLEIRGFVDDQVVYRYWLRTKGYFGYGMESLLSFGFDLEDRDKRGDKRGPALVKCEVQNWDDLGLTHEDLDED